VTAKRASAISSSVTLPRAAVSSCSSRAAAAAAAALCASVGGFCCAPADVVTTTPAKTTAAKILCDNTATRPLATDIGSPSKWGGNVADATNRSRDSGPGAPSDVADGRVRRRS
jgi:hypothetical protein